MINENVIFKGTKDGVIVKVKGMNNLTAIKEAIETKLHESKDFFKNSKIYIDFSEAHIDREHQREIKQIFSQNYDVSLQSIQKRKSKIFNGIYEGRTKFISSTIRSGQGVEFPGNVVIIGDINAGGYISAGGNIIVMGALRGMAHAGASGNEKAIIAAFSLLPTQIRIATIISRSPDGEILKPKFPEMARIKDGIIVIEPYSPNKSI